MEWAKVTWMRKATKMRTLGKKVKEMKKIFILLGAVCRTLL